MPLNSFLSHTECLWINSYLIRNASEFIPISYRMQTPRCSHKQQIPPPISFIFLWWGCFASKYCTKMKKKIREAKNLHTACSRRPRDETIISTKTSDTEDINDNITLKPCHNNVSYLSRLFLIFPGAQQNFNGSQRNIQGDLDRYDVLTIIVYIPWQSSSI